MTDTTDDYGYLLVHFIEDPDGYWVEILPAERNESWIPADQRTDAQK